jgi:hypothetical protein
MTYSASSYDNGNQYDRKSDLPPQLSVQSLTSNTHTPPTYVISSNPISKSRKFKIANKKTEIVTFLKRVPNLSLREWERNVTKMAEEYCWAITQAAGRSSCGPSSSSVLKFGFQLDSLVYTYTAEHMHTEFWLAHNSTCATPSWT